MGQTEARDLLCTCKKHILEASGRVVQRNMPKHLKRRQKFRDWDEVPHLGVMHPPA